jgi:hypothetical protein
MSLFMAHPLSAETAATAKKARAAVELLGLLMFAVGPLPRGRPGEGARKGRTVSWPG